MDADLIARVHQTMGALQVGKMKACNLLRSRRRRCLTVLR
jgi:hypothetical protein